jgi:hypothetical protein
MRRVRHVDHPFDSNCECGTYIENQSESGPMLRIAAQQLRQIPERPTSAKGVSLSGRRSDLQD